MGHYKPFKSFGVLLAVKKASSCIGVVMGEFNCFIHAFELATIEELLALRPMGGLELVESKSRLHSRSKPVCISNKTVEHNYSNSNSISPFSRLS